MRYQHLFDSHGVGLFFLYLITGIALWAAFNWLYTWSTPYHEHEDIRAGKMAPAISLVGAELGFMMPLFAASYHGSWLAFLAWGIFSGLIQLGLFRLMWWRMQGIETGNCAVALNFAGASVCLGIIVAFSQIP